jgi:hypothetical protein
MHWELAGLVLLILAPRSWRRALGTGARRSTLSVRPSRKNSRPRPHPQNHDRGYIHFVLRNCVAAASDFTRAPSVTLQMLGHRPLGLGNASGASGLRGGCYP